MSRVKIGVQRSVTSFYGVWGGGGGNGGEEGGTTDDCIAFDMGTHNTTVSISPPRGKACWIRYKLLESFI